MSPLAYFIVDGGFGTLIDVLVFVLIVCVLIWLIRRFLP